jgi:hypothetical protein
MPQNILEQFLNCISIFAVIVMLRHRTKACSEQHIAANWVFCRRHVICLIVALDPADSVGWDTAVLIAREAPEAAAHMAGFLDANQLTA